MTKAAKPQTAKGKEAPTEAPGVPLRHPEWWMVGLTALTLAVMGAISALQYKIARDTLRIANRAYVTVNTSRIYQVELGTETVSPGTMLGKVKAEQSDVGPLRAGDRPIVEVVLMNSGVTPATQVRTHTWFGILSQLPTDEPNYSTTPGEDPASAVENTSVLAHERTISTVRYRPAPLTAEEAANIAGSKQYVVMYGIARYRDVFDEERTTHFCMMYNPRQFNMAACPNHNRID